MYAITIYTYPLRDYSPKGDRVHRYHIVRYYNNYRIYIIPPAPSFPLRVWPSGFALDSFRRFAGWLLFSSSLGEISASLVGRCQEKPFLGKNLFLAALFQENPSLFWEKPVFSSVLIGVGRHFSLFILYRSSGDFCVGKTRLGKNL